MKLTIIEVGSRGMLADEAFNGLKEAIEALRKEFTFLCLQSIRNMILGSFNMCILISMLVLKNV